MDEYGSLGAVIWDLDDVIVDPGPYHFRSWHEALEKRSLTVTDAQLR